MIGRLGLLAAALLAGVGCVNCRYSGYEESLAVVPESPIPPPVRNQVFLFMMNGHDVMECGGMLALRDRLCLAGYPMVYYAQRADREWYTRELRRVTRDNPGARILLLGYGSAAPVVTGLAYEAVRDELPIDSVIYLDPVGASQDLVGSLPYHSVVVRSRNWRGGRGLATTETVEVANTGHYALPTDEATVDVLLQLLTAATSQVVLSPPTMIPSLPLRDKPDPTPRGVHPATVGQPLDDWDFLKPGSPFPTLSSHGPVAPAPQMMWFSVKEGN